MLRNNFINMLLSFSILYVLVLKDFAKIFCEKMTFLKNIFKEHFRHFKEKFKEFEVFFFNKKQFYCSFWARWFVLVM